MKVSVSLSSEDLAFVDDFAAERGTSRSAAVHEAILTLRRSGLASEYEAAADEWAASGEAVAWAAVSADGLG